MLDDRKAAILCALVQEYIHTAQPVGSSRISDSPGVEVSSATVRSEMASLEDREYLSQPHTSAGRVPTAKAYRFFVNQMQDQTPTLRESDCQQVSDFFSVAQGELSALLGHTAWLLSDLTDWTGVVVSASPAVAVVRSAQLIKVASCKTLVLAVMSNGSVEKRLLDVDASITSEVVADASRRLAAQVVGRTLADVGTRNPDPGDASSSPSHLDYTGDLADPLLFAALDALHEASEHYRVFVGGRGKLADAFDAVEQLRAVLSLLEQQFAIVTLIQELIDSGNRVAIGVETGLPSLSGCSLVLAPYSVSGADSGTIGVIGPTRMDYLKAISAVNVVGQQLSVVLSEA